LWERLLKLCEIHEAQFRWVRGHAGHSENERCDELAKAAARSPDLVADPGYLE
jgi:ribonuclease HI